MDLQQFLLVCMFLLSFLKLGRWSKWFKLQKPRSKLPPGPLKLPLIGNLHKFSMNLPHHSLRDLARIHGPIMSLKLGEISVVVISSPKFVKEMMKTHDDKFLDRPFNTAASIMTYGRRDIAMAPYGDYWRQVRKICALQLFNAKRVQSFWSVREEEVMKLVDWISGNVAGSPINLSEKLFTLTNDMTSRSAFGRMCKDRENFMCLIKEVLEMGSGFSLHDLFPSLKFLEVLSGIKPKLEKMFMKSDKILEDIIKEHKENRSSNEEDLVDVLLRVHEDKDLGFPISLENVKAVIFDVFSAGTDTSSTTLEWTFSELLRNPRVMEKVQAEVRQVFSRKKKIIQSDLNELNYLKLVIKECLRLHPPGPLLLPRECREKCEMEEYEIPKGTTVLVNAWAIGRDPEHWKDPESFEPERFQEEQTDYMGTNFKYVPFGAGKRMCPGNLFGIANIELPLALLLYHFNWKLTNGIKPHQLEMTEGFGTVVRRLNDLHVIPTAYYPDSGICQLLAHP
ncbi:hypothetical protein ACHQM5_016704 [Ranunculus cassubicifolius]